jgi:hypothetical protein
LGELLGRRLRFRAEVERFSTKRGWKGGKVNTILLKDITDLEGNFLADHLWLLVGSTFDWLNVRDRIEFDARVTKYAKGYSETDSDQPFRDDYTLSRPTRVIKTHYYDEGSQTHKATEEE